MWNSNAACKIDEGSISTQRAVALSDRGEEVYRIGFKETSDVFGAQRELGWLDAVIERLSVLSRLRENWDSYGAKKIARDNIETALILLATLRGPNTPEPTIVPTVTGGIQLEWHRNGIDLEIEIRSATELVVFYEDEAKRDVQEMTLTYDLSPLIALISRLSQ